jgi:hypothetical protein
MRSFALLAIFASTTIAIAGDCGAGRQGLFARRAERKAARSSCASGSCESATLTEETVQAAEIRTTKSTPVKTITGPSATKITIVPTGAAKSVAPGK